MPTTPNHELPYPTLADPADVPGDIEALATRLDDIVTGTLLAYKFYVPAGDVSIRVPASVWGGLSASDPNLTIGPIIMPGSGRVIVKMSGGLVRVDQSAVVIAGISTTPGGLPASSNPIASIAAGAAQPYACELPVEGLAPGEAFTFYPWMYPNGSDGHLSLSNSGLNGGGFLMQVHSA